MLNGAHKNLSNLLLNIVTYSENKTLEAVVTKNDPMMIGGLEVWIYLFRKEVKNGDSL
jgi:hypothetical protein